MMKGIRPKLCLDDMDFVRSFIFMLETRDGSLLQFTASEIMNAGGTRYNGVGLTPDVEVAMPAYARFPVLQVNGTCRLGDRSEGIRLDRQYLEALGFNPGHTDGVFDEQTESALKTMQAKIMPEPTGELDAASALAMAEMLRNLIRENDTRLQKGVEVLKERMVR